jgi:hypothetical protein
MKFLSIFAIFLVVLLAVQSSHVRRTETATTTEKTVTELDVVPLLKKAGKVVAQSICGAVLKELEAN